MTFESLWQDLRYALRGLWQKPGFAAAAVLTLGLGIGANPAMFGVTDRLLFRAPSYMKDPDRVHRVERWTSSFDAVAAVTDPNAAVGVGEDTREMRIAP